MYLVATHVFAGAGIALFYFILAAFAQVRSLSYHKEWYLFVILYIAGSTSLVYYFLYHSVPIFSPYETFRPFACIALVLLLVGTYFFNRKYPIKKSIRKKYPKSFFLNFNTQFITVKAFDILFQDIIIIGIILALAQYFSVPVAFWVFSTLFFTVHYALVFLQGKASTFHIVGSLIAGAVFPALILFVPGGGFFTYALHFLGYTLARIFAPFFLKG